MEENIDYKVTTTSSYKFNQLECQAEFEFFRSFRDNDVEFSLDPSLYSGKNMIISDDDNPVYVKSGLYNIEKYQRWVLYQFFGFC
jgi:hypothetical protein